MSQAISGLLPNSTYYVRMFARNQDGDIEEGKELQFSTSRLPVAAYSLDTGEGEVAEDVTGNEHEGEIEGAEWFDRGKYGKALDFDGENDCITIADAEDLRITEDLTVEAWVKPRSLEGPIIYKDTWGYMGHELAIGIFGEGTPEAVIGEGEGEFESVTAPEALEPNVWAHLAFTYDGGHMRLYVNGELVDSQAQSEGPPWGEGDLVIGCNPNYPPERFDGLIDEVRVYNRALDAGELQNDQRTGIEAPSRSPVAAYSLDTGEGEVAEDVTGNEHEGEIEGAEWFDRGKYGKALDFDGENDCITIADAEDLRITEDLTVEAWVKPRSLEGPIIYKDTWGYMGHELAIGIFGEGTPEAVIGEGEGEFESVTAPEALEPNVWAHLAFTYDGGHMRLYVNGELVDSQAQSEGPPWGEGDLVIGCNPNYPPERFDGLIDEVRVYNRALDAGELAADKATPIGE